MKVLALVIFAVASVSSSGSGPYLPSGWRPQGPAFYLPSEVQKSSENPLQDVILNESEASSSDALREYGPPKVVEVSQDLTSQALPETETEQAFVAIEAKFAEEVNGEVKEAGEVTAVEEAKEATEAAVDAVEVTAEEKAIEEAVTEINEEKTTETVQNIPQGRAIDVQAIEETVEIQEATTEKVEAATAQVTEVKTIEVDSNVESSQVEQVSQVQEVQEVSPAEVRTVEGVQNVVEALTNLEKEIKAQQVQTNDEAVDVKSVQVLGSVEQATEGFLEYGPPGFREYGPPQAEDLVRTEGLVQEQTEEEQKIESNETRRRRFSPKLRFRINGN
ncbi:probable serine/threonine-protein kinase kinX [Cydia strobilella]|uniref:probable serine/threonine-protein kinase kinX n=1 Tax=Cydia strobilella TaxID=1100964 RepID=UPI0030046FDE